MSASPTPGPSSGQDDQFEEDKPYVKRRKYTFEILKMYNLPRVMRNLGTVEKCTFTFSQEKSLVANQKLCPKHNIPMKIKQTTNKSFGSCVCNKGKCHNKNTVARTKGTFFENIKIDLRYVYYLIYAYSHDWSYATTILEDPYKDEKNKCLSRVTISDWFNYCRETVAIYQLEKQEYVGKLGGPGKIVQIDESKFGKRKSNKGK